MALPRRDNSKNNNPHRQANGGGGNIGMPMPSGEPSLPVPSNDGAPMPSSVSQRQFNANDAYYDRGAPTDDYHGRGRGDGAYRDSMNAMPSQSGGMTMPVYPDDNTRYPSQGRYGYDDGYDNVPQSVSPQTVHNGYGTVQNGQSTPTVSRQSEPDRNQQGYQNRYHGSNQGYVPGMNDMMSSDDGYGNDDYTMDDDGDYLSEEDLNNIPVGAPDSHDTGYDDSPIEPVYGNEQIDPDDIRHKKQVSKKAEEKRQAEDNRETRESRKSKHNNDGELGKSKQKDAAQKAKVVQYTVIGLLVVAVLLGLGRLVIPQHQWSESDIKSISQVANGSTGFPMEQGAGIAEQFIKAYITSTDPSSSAMLDVFYNGTTLKDANGKDNNPSTNQNTPDGIEQRIVSGPTLYNEASASSEVATYLLGTVVYRFDTKANRPVVSADGKTPEYKWVFYQVDVHYDKNTEKFVIAKNSPIRVPDPRISDVSQIPQYKKPGNGQEATDIDTKQMQDLVTTFFKAWANSDESAMVNITDSTSKPSVHRGMNGELQISGDPSFVVYGPPSTDQYYRALVTVNWKEPLGPDGNGYTQTSMYVLKLKKTGNKFIVFDVQPYMYIPDNDTQ